MSAFELALRELNSEIECTKAKLESLQKLKTKLISEGGHPACLALSDYLPKTILLCIQEFMTDKFCGLCWDLFPAHSFCICAPPIDFRSSSAYFHRRRRVDVFRSIEFCDLQTQAVWEYSGRKLHGHQVRFENFSLLFDDGLIERRWGGPDCTPFHLRLMNSGAGWLVQWILQPDINSA
jgi:hypothetical protein